MNVEIVTIGDELLIGQVIDSNSSWMAQVLECEGFRVSRKTTVGDVAEDIEGAVHDSLQRVDVVLLTGGIGPTNDDITLPTLCRFFGTELIFSDEVFENIRRIFDYAGRPMNELTKKQAFVPADCTVIQNQAGTAPCTWFERNGKVVVSMPGVPYEMKWLMTNEIIPRLCRRFNSDTIVQHHTVWVAGLPESALATLLSCFENDMPPLIRLAYLPQPGIVRLRLTAVTTDRATANEAIIQQTEKLRNILGNHIIAEEDQPIEEIIGSVLIQKGLCLGTAESCTGGRISSMITSVPGSSEYFAGSVVAYANDVKVNVLGVSATDIEKYGAVSREVVEQMAMGALRVLGCNCSVAVSGIAGPGGGTEAKPVGTVWIAAANKGRVISECHHFTTFRETNISRSSNMALLLLLDLLKNI